jgi:hypothetical protein
MRNWMGKRCDNDDNDDVCVHLPDVPHSGALLILDPHGPTRGDNMSMNVDEHVDRDMSRKTSQQPATQRK